MGGRGARGAVHASPQSWCDDEAFSWTKVLISPFAHCLSHRAAQVQLRKWIRNVDALERALPTTKCLAPQARLDSSASDDEASSQASVPTMPNSPSLLQAETRVSSPASLSTPLAAAFAATPTTYDALCTPAIQVAKPVPVYAVLPFSSASRFWNSTALLRGSNDGGRLALSAGFFLPQFSTCNAMRRPVMAAPVAHDSSGEPPPVCQAAKPQANQSERAVAMELINMSCSMMPTVSASS